jgi:hypothetical protein
MTNSPQPTLANPPAGRRSLGARVLGAALLFASVGLVSCQALFFL